MQHPVASASPRTTGASGRRGGGLSRDPAFSPAARAAPRTQGPPQSRQWWWRRRTPTSSSMGPCSHYYRHCSSSSARAIMLPPSAAAADSAAADAPTTPTTTPTILASSAATAAASSLLQHVEGDDTYDVVVVGAGHAGCEAALASARMGARTLLLTLTLDKVGWQPCNPAVGGPAKSQLVHEVDALGGEIGRMADRTYVQKRVLNASKGPAVWALRAQTDKQEYSRVMRRVLETQANLFLREAMVTGVAVDGNGEVAGVTTFFGLGFRAKAVVLTTGTFMNGRIWVGRQSMSAGRAGEGASAGLTEALVALGFEAGRLKTGTPARVDSRTVDYSRLEEQPGDARVRWFSHDPEARVERPQLSCWLTRTTAETHALVKGNLSETPVYGGWVDAKGPRYCPSIEDKIVRFADKESHQIFLEPEGRNTPELYVQGFSTGLPERLQRALLRTLPGLEQCAILRPAYAVEYDYMPATQCHATLETKRIGGLFFSGQLNGTTGYEEAAAQGLLAGVNAARRAQSLPTVSLPRESSYLGTLIDDLVTKEDLREPYRVLTSRSEYRLLLRADNADARLTPTGREWGLVQDAQWRRYEARRARIAAERARLARERVGAGSAVARAAAEASGQPVTAAAGATLEELLRRPHVHHGLLVRHGAAAPYASYREACEAAEAAADEEGAAPPGEAAAAAPAPEKQSLLTEDEAEAAETDIKYAGFIARQQRQVDQAAQRGRRLLPQGIDYAAIPTLSLEAREKLGKVRPRDVGQASRISGVSPADVQALLLWLEVQRRRRGAGEEEAGEEAQAGGAATRPQAKEAVAAV